MYFRQHIFKHLLRNMSRRQRTALCILIFLMQIPLFSAVSKLSADPRVASALQFLEMWADAQFVYGRIPGMSMGIVYDQELIWSKGFGYADVQKKIPATAQTIYSICSISKLFTSISILQLRDCGLLRLDDPVEKYLPWLKIKQAFKNSPPITIEGLLTHSAGLPREADFPYWTNADFPTREEIINQVAKQETLYPARKYFQYSNLGLTLAGAVVEKVSGKPFAEYVQQNILTPLDLKDTSSEIPINKRGGQLATGYSAFKRDGSRITMPAYEVKGVAPAAGFASSVIDLAKFASWQFRLLKEEGNEILAANSLREMQRIHWVDPNDDITWGIGFMVAKKKHLENNKLFVGHGGHCPGYLTNLELQMDNKIATICLVNADGVNLENFSDRAYEIMAPVIKETIDAPGKGQETDAKLLKYVGIYEAPLGSEVAILIWKGEICMIYFPTDDPLKAMSKFKYISENAFRRIRDNGDLGEQLIFESGKDGKIVKMTQHSNYFIKK